MPRIKEESAHPDSTMPSRSPSLSNNELPAICQPCWNTTHKIRLLRTVPLENVNYDLCEDPEFEACTMICPVCSTKGKRRKETIIRILNVLFFLLAMYGLVQ